MKFGLSCYQSASWTHFFAINVKVNSNRFKSLLQRLDSPFCFHVDTGKPSTWTADILGHPLSLKYAAWKMRRILECELWKPSLWIQHQLWHRSAQVRKDMFEIIKISMRSLKLDLQLLLFSRLNTMSWKYQGKHVDTENCWNRLKSDSRLSDMKPGLHEERSRRFSWRMRLCQQDR